MDNYSDLKLAELLSMDSEAAFNEIYNRYWASVFLVARNRLKNDLEAEEIVQNIFCHLWRKRRTFQLKKTFQIYFAVAVKYEVINLSVKKQREINFVEHVSRHGFNVDNSTLQKLSYNELKHTLEKTICVLPERCQLVFRLRIESEYTQKEIAKELAISEKTVETHLTKARKHIRDTLDPALIPHVIILINMISI